MCQPNCMNIFCLMTVKQIGNECKEVIRCSLTAIKVFSFLLVEMAPDEPVIYEFESYKRDLLRIFKVYLNFSQMMVQRQLNGLPSLPRYFIESLNSDWKFVKEISVSIQRNEAPVVSVCKYVEICTQIFHSNELFLQTAVNAIFTSTSYNKTK